MHNDSLIPGFVCGPSCLVFFALCTLAFIRQVYSITKMPTYGLYEYKVEGSGCGLNRKQGLVETGLLFIINFDMF